MEKNHSDRDFDLCNLGRILRLLTEVVSHLEDCELGLTKEVEDLLREGLKTSDSILDHCVRQTSARTRSDKLAHKMGELLEATRSVDTTQARQETECSQKKGSNLFGPEKVVIREVEENGHFHLEIETVGSEGGDEPDPPLEFSSAEVDSALGLFDNMEETRSNPDTDELETPLAPWSDHETNQIQTLFQDIATQYVAPLSRIMGELYTGRASRQTIEGAVGVFRNLLNAAEAMKLTATSDLASNLVDLFSASEMTGVPPTDVELKAIKAHYDALRSQHPDMFPEPSWNPDSQDKIREKLDLDSIVVMEELKSIPGLGKRRIERLFEAGLSSLPAFLTAKPEDFQAVGRMGKTLSKRVSRSFLKYGRSFANPKNGLHPRFKRRLALYLRILKDSQYHYRRAVLDENYSGGSKAGKKVNGSIRKRTSCRVLAFLAYLQRPDDVRSFQGMSYDRRIQLLEKVLSEKNPTTT